MGLMRLFRRQPKDLAVRVVHGALEDRRGGTGMTNGGGRNPFDEFQVRSLVADGMVIDGDLASERGAAVDGVINGNVKIRAANAALLIRGGAHITGNVDAAVVFVRGRVDGNIRGRFVRLYAGCQVNGTIESERLMIDDGARLKGPGMGVGATTAKAITPAPASTAAASAEEAPAGAGANAETASEPAKVAGVDDFIAAMQQRARARAVAG